jgi:hypothetical protein
MSVRHLLAAVDSYAPTTRRLVATVAALATLAGAVIGGLALARSAGRPGTGSARPGGIVAGALGLTGMVVGGPAVARSRDTT